MNEHHSLLSLVEEPKPGREGGNYAGSITAEMALTTDDRGRSGRTRHNGQPGIVHCAAQPSVAVFGVAVWPTRQEPQEKFPVRCSAQDFGEHRWCVVVANHQVVPGSGIQGDPGVAEVRMDHTRLVLLVVVNP
jgi:hypothetical protein